MQPRQFRGRQLEPLMLEGEEWRDIDGIPYYQVSNFGRFKSLATARPVKRKRPIPVYDRILTQAKFYGRDRQGKKRTTPLALMVNPCINGKMHYKYIHALVLTAFVGPKPEGMECCHIDGNPLNNHVSNLRWGTHSDNMQDSIRHGTFKRKSRLLAQQQRSIEIGSPR